jgi:hypothetical protein
MEKHKFGDPEYVKARNKLIAPAAAHADEVIGGPPEDEELEGLSVRKAKKQRSVYTAAWTICFLEEMDRLANIHLYGGERKW